MAQFSLKRTFASVALIAIGVASLSSAIGRYCFTNPEYVSFEHINFWLVAWMTAGLWIGAGLGVPWRYPIRGACIGAIIQIIVWGSLGHFR